jgi:hypothetical protein
MTTLDLSRIAGFQWDRGNSRKNDKHGVRQEEAEEIFESGALVLIEDPAHSQDEPRYRAFGLTSAGRKLQIAFTLRESDTLIRVISARPMSAKEQESYEAQTRAQTDPPLS